MTDNDKILIKKLKKSMRLKVIVLLGILLSFNTFAWFVYNATITTSVTGHVKSWKITFEAGNVTSEHFTFNLSDLYPGMNNYVQDIRIVNYSDTQAEVSYKLKKVRILNQTYSENNYSSEELFAILNNNPFNVTFSFDKTILNPEDDFATFSLEVSWPYEQNKDNDDTIWGHNAYLYKQANPGASEIEMEIFLSAKQIN